MCAEEKGYRCLKQPSAWKMGFVSSVGSHVPADSKGLPLKLCPREIYSFQIQVFEGNLLKIVLNQEQQCTSAVGGRGSNVVAPDL